DYYCQSFDSSGFVLF
nr:immunoglobulin light chain junction region [Macaca mulatta]MOW04350.1 immunoglobulin light chain junction region [Macaca mulatta]MOW04586.1 immunoglobulin light chain junction region [Macaca mulatta]MOW04967.1 immunoglobulin light chain junction region [Macaca mulatta]MOW05423.1 immunoglobulin light chain junction region [Macaca mulatta]